MTERVFFLDHIVTSCSTRNIYVKIIIMLFFNPVVYIFRLSRTICARETIEVSIYCVKRVIDTIAV